MQTKSKVKNGWVCCGKCGHKLGRLVGDKLPTGLEIKCSSCKEINIVEVEKERLYKAIDLQGAGFADNRQLTVEGWREQALMWCDMDEDDETYDYIELLRQDKVLEFIAGRWDLEFTEVKEDGR